MSKITKGGPFSFEYEYERISGDEVDYPLLTVTGNISSYDPGNLYGLPENCYPPEGGEVEDLQFFWADGSEFTDPPDKLVQDVEEYAIERWIDGARDA